MKPIFTAWWIPLFTAPSQWILPVWLFAWILPCLSFWIIFFFAECCTISFKKACTVRAKRYVTLLCDHTVTALMEIHAILVVTFVRDYDPSHVAREVRRCCWKLTDNQVISRGCRLKWLSRQLTTGHFWLGEYFIWLGKSFVIERWHWCRHVTFGCKRISDSPYLPNTCAGDDVEYILL